MSDGDLSRRAVIYKLKWLFFRKCLDLKEDIRLDALFLEEILNGDFDFDKTSP